MFLSLAAFNFDMVKLPLKNITFRDIKIHLYDFQEQSTKNDYWSLCGYPLLYPVAMAPAQKTITCDPRGSFSQSSMGSWKVLTIGQSLLNQRTNPSSKPATLPHARGHFTCQRRTIAHNEGLKCFSDLNRSLMWLVRGSEATPFSFAWHSNRFKWLGEALSALDQQPDVSQSVRCLCLFNTIFATTTKNIFDTVFLWKNVQLI